MFHRFSERVNVNVTIQCTFKGRRFDAHLYNLSLDGCMLDVPDLCLDSGDFLTVDFIDEISHPGEVIWSKSGNIGVKFNEPIHVAILRLFQWVPSAETIASLTPMDRFGRVLPG